MAEIVSAIRRLKQIPILFKTPAAIATIPINLGPPARTMVAPARAAAAKELIFFVLILSCTAIVFQSAAVTAAPQSGPEQPPQDGSPLPDTRVDPQPGSEPDAEPESLMDVIRNESIEGALEQASNQKYFRADNAMDLSALRHMDCHLRNVDFCFAGLMGAVTRIMPENDDQFETRCDEIKSASNCMLVYNMKCQSDRFMSMLAPFGALTRKTTRPSEVLARSMNVEAGTVDRMLAQQIDKNTEAVLTNKSPEEVDAVAERTAPITYKTLLDVCEPDQKKDPANARLRQYLYKMGKCVNERVPKLQPCIEDLKTALMIFYEPRRKLPLKPSCCAMARFRSCTTEALDSVCGLSSLDLMLEQFGSLTPVSGMKSIQKVCGQSMDPSSKYCTDVLPPSGMKAPKQKRPERGSKLARALDLMSFAPATQPM